MQIKEMAIADLVPYEKNPRNNDCAVEAVANSIKEFGFKIPIVIDKNNVVVCGHTRLKAANKLRLKRVPVIIADDLSEKQIKAFRLADNKVGEIATWNDYILDIELGEIADLDFDMQEFGFEEMKNNEWFNERNHGSENTDEQSEEYKEFVEKFEEKRTTDDCYTPAEVFEQVEKYVAEHYGVNKKKFIRPFYPGGDYTKEEYKGRIVVDNPPFSIMSEILQFYQANEIKYFMFAPSVTCFANRTVHNGTAICCGATITYENGAKVSTSFVTNMDPKDVQARTDPGLTKAIKEADEIVRKDKTKELTQYKYPDNVVTAAMLNYLSIYGIEFEIKRKDCVHIRELDSQKDIGKAIFGSGFLLSEKAAAEKAAAEKAAAEKAAAEKAAAIVLELSDREKEIIKKLG